MKTKTQLFHRFLQRLDQNWSARITKHFLSFSTSPCKLEIADSHTKAYVDFNSRTLTGKVMLTLAIQRLWTWSFHIYKLQLGFLRLQKHTKNKWAHSLKLFLIVYRLLAPSSKMRMCAYMWCVTIISLEVTYLIQMHFKVEGSYCVTNIVRRRWHKLQSWGLTC